MCNDRDEPVRSLEGEAARKALRRLVTEACPANWFEDPAADAWRQAARICGVQLPGDGLNGSTITGSE